MIRLSLSIAVAALLLAAPAGAMGHPKLIGVVGKNDAFTISLKTGSGKLVQSTKIKAGLYTFVIHDDSTLHNFELDGPRGFAHKFTDVSSTGTKTTTLRLKAGKYKYYCVAHESQMFHFFTVKK